MGYAEPLPAEVPGSSSAHHHPGSSSAAVCYGLRKGSQAGWTRAQGCGWPGWLSSQQVPSVGPRSPEGYISIYTYVYVEHI